MNKFKKELIVLAVFLVAASAISIYFYGEFKESGVNKVPIHWNINNEADNFASPLVASLIGPAVIILIMVATVAMSRKEYSKSEKRSTRFVILLVAALMVFINWVALKSASGYGTEEGFDISLVHLGLGLIFILIGNQFGKMPQSRWIGIRVPATLNNEEVWNRVHRKAGKLMVLSGVFVFSATFISDETWSIFFYIPLMISLILMIFVLPAIEKKKVENEGKLNKNN
ncbi:MAG: SdpI family protein [Candidatus Marinimicrobia bacterium]|nr:SdpI family protein [Candidatus Neomarinimicrobiota bacterium]